MELQGVQNRAKKITANPQTNRKKHVKLCGSIDEKVL
jgi:hypothetical protein